MSEFGPESIVVSDDLKAVRLRPGMFFGDLGDGSGLLNAIWEVIGNSIDQHLMRRARQLAVEVLDSWIVVVDDGPGIPVDIVPSRGGKSALEVIMTSLHVGPTYDGHIPHTHIRPGLHGVGIAAVNAVCSRLEVETVRNGFRYAQQFERGRRASDLSCLGPTDAEGTTIRFQPDPQIFGKVALDAVRIRERLEELAWLNPLLAITYQKRLLPGRGGLSEWLEVEAPGEAVARYSTFLEVEKVAVDVALRWCGSLKPSIRSFVNLGASESGTHIKGLWRGLGSWVSALGGPKAGAALLQRQLSPGLSAIVHVGLYGPEFAGPTRAQLKSPLAGKAVYAALKRDIPRVQRDQQLCQFLLDRLAKL